MPGSSGFVTGTPYYRIGKRYIEVLETTVPQSPESSNARARIEAIDQAALGRKPAR